MHSFNIQETLVEKKKYYLIISHVPALVLGAGHISEQDRFYILPRGENNTQANHTLKSVIVTCCGSWQAIL